LVEPESNHGPSTRALTEEDACIRRRKRVLRAVRPSKLQEQRREGFRLHKSDSSIAREGAQIVKDYFGPGRLDTLN